MTPAPTNSQQKTERKLRGDEDDAIACSSRSVVNRTGRAFTRRARNSRTREFEVAIPTRQAIVKPS